MFNNITILKSAEDYKLSDENLLSHSFRPTGLTETRSLGWVAPHPGAPDLAMRRGQDTFLKVCIETRSVPTDILNKEVARRVAQIKSWDGRDPGRKELREIREDAHLALLPQAFPAQKFVWVWLDPGRSRVILDATSKTAIDLVSSLLVTSIPSMVVAHIETKTTPCMAMTTWLTDAGSIDETDFEVGTACQLKADDESKQTITYKNHDLALPEIGAHILEGKLPVKLELDYMGRVVFVLTESGSLKKVTLIDIDLEEDQDENDGNMHIIAGELRVLIDELLHALGGEAG